ncbi:MAG: hypothetical protein IT437_01750 [Phycisphaerales bacterium]|nr:hypothetical protein [Phycisphaerales bacterium]
MKTIALALVAAAALDTGLGLPKKAAAPAVMWMGAHSRVTTPRFEQITSKERWEEVWHEHTGEGRRFQDRPYTIPPEVDFSTFMVIAYFRGPSTNIDGERVEAIDRVDDTLRIRFDSLSYQTASFDGEDHGVAVEPFGLWVVETWRGPVVIEENTQGLIGGPPIWTEKHRFDRRTGE